MPNSELSRGPLDGVRVLEWSVFGVGPFAGALLGSLGADVIKVETPPSGDPQQYIPPTINGVASLYINFNTSKRSVHLDLKSRADREWMWRLVGTSDVFFSNFRADVCDRLGFGYAEVRSRNPDIIYLTCSGWGEFGPMKDQGGGDNWVQAFSGWCSVMGPEGGPAEFLRYLGHIDLNASAYIVAGVLAALVGRRQFGGQEIKMSMLEAALSMQSTRLAEYLQASSIPQPMGSASPVCAPDEAFVCADSKFIAVSAETEAQWQSLCRAIGRDDLLGWEDFSTNSRRVGNRSRLSNEVGKVFRSKHSRWWILRLQEHRVPCSLFWDFELLRHHAQITSNRHLVEVDTGRSGTVYTGGAPWKFGHASAVVTRSPSSGEHTEELVRELGVEDSRDAPPDVSTERRPFADALPLDGLRVVEFAYGVAGPYCGSLFADLGAQVTKVEWTASGDYVRNWMPKSVGAFEDVSVAFVELNRNKRLEWTTLSSSFLPQSVRSRIEEADVVILDYPEVGAEQLGEEGLTVEAIRDVNAAAVVCVVSPYGEMGPLADLPGSELTVQAMTNVWAGLGKIGEAPRRLGAYQASMNCGVFAFQGALAALWRRLETGNTDSIHTSLLGSMMTIKGMHWTSLTNPDQWPGLHLSVWTDPPQHGYTAADCRILFNLNASLSKPPNEDNVRRFVLALGGDGIPAGMDVIDRFAFGTQRHPWHPRWTDFWNDLFLGHDWTHIARIAADYGAEIVPFHDYASLDRDSQVVCLNPFNEIDLGDGGKRRIVRPPWRLPGMKSGYAFSLPGGDT